MRFHTRLRQRGCFADMRRRYRPSRVSFFRSDRPTFGVHSVIGPMDRIIYPNTLGIAKPEDTFRDGFVHMDVCNHRTIRAILVAIQRSLANDPFREVHATIEFSKLDDFFVTDVPPVIPMLDIFCSSDQIIHGGVKLDFNIP